MEVPRQRLDWKCVEIKFLEVQIFLYVSIKIGEMPCIVIWNGIPENSASVPNWVFEKLCAETRDSNVVALS